MRLTMQRADQLLKEFARKRFPDHSVVDFNVTYFDDTKPENTEIAVPAKAWVNDSFKRDFIGLLMVEQSTQASKSVPHSEAPKRYLTDQEINFLIDEGYKQISNAKCLVVKVPKDISIWELLERDDPEMLKGFIRNAENWWRRVHGAKKGMEKYLSSGDFKRFKELGGEVA